MLYDDGQVVKLFRVVSGGLLLIIAAERNFNFEPSGIEIGIGLFHSKFKSDMQD